MQQHEFSRHLSQYVHAAEEGVAYVITRRGKPVARMVPFDNVEEQRVFAPKQEAALERTRQRVEQGDIGKIDREAMYFGALGA